MTIYLRNDKYLKGWEEAHNVPMSKSTRLATGEEKKLIFKLLNKLCGSLNMEFPQGVTPCLTDYEELLSGFGDPKNGVRWSKRFDAWVHSKRPPVAWMGLSDGTFYFTKDSTAGVSCWEEGVLSLLPIFPHYLEKSPELKDLLPKTTKEQTNMKSLNNNFVQKMMGQNQDAVKLSAKMSVGKAANQVLTSKLAGTFPWYAKLFNKHKEAVNNPFVRIGTAEAVLAAVEHFYPENTKLKYVAEAMLQEAMIDVATNSSALNGLISELEALAGKLPGEDK